MSEQKPLKASEYRDLVNRGLLDYNVDAQWLQDARLALHDAARAQEMLDKLQEYMKRCAIMREEPKKMMIQDILDGGVVRTADGKLRKNE